MVCLTENPSLREASCWSVDVVNGGGGVLFNSFSSMDATFHSFPSTSLITVSDSSLVLGTNFSPLYLLRSAVNVSFLSVSSEAVIVQYSTGTNALISRSRSTMIFTATDCTRPALSPRYTFFHKKCESV